MASLQTLVSFDRINGGLPAGSLIADASGNLYGTTLIGGPVNYGTVFKIAADATSPTGYGSAPITLATFNDANGNGPADSLIADASGNLYGTTQYGGANDGGTVFKIAADATSPTGYSSAPTTLVAFDGFNGRMPLGNLIADASGNLYGTTSGGGPSYNPEPESGQRGFGTIFKLTPDATSSTGYSSAPTTLVAFGAAGGRHPQSSLISDASGNFYGTTLKGGPDNAGTVFKLTPDATNPTGYSNTPTTLVAFDGFNGLTPEGSLIADASGNLYGTTLKGGARDAGTVFRIAADPTSPTGYSSTPTILVSFDRVNASLPKGDLIADAAGNLYGTTSSGANGGGTVFRIAADATSPTGYSSTPTILVTLSGSSGSSPYGNLIADAKGNLYGTTLIGGGGIGSVFKISDAGFVVCYGAGTRIRTAHGEVPVEALRVGDLAVTSSGEQRPIRWISSTVVDCRAHPRPVSVLPIRIGKGALGPNRPARDLLVSPRHGICLDLLGEVLVPADKLVNGATITQEAVDAITYWHVELDSHDLLVAEGIAAESYLDLGNRGFFAGEGTGPDDAMPGAPSTRADGCRPFVEGGELIDFARRRLHERARAIGWTKRTDPLAGLHLAAEGRVFEPVVEGTHVRFLLPAGCGDARLVSRTTVPALVSGGSERRRLGVNVRRLAVEDGLGVPREIALDDARLDAGFHGIEGRASGRHRWTRGDALLPAGLWAECRDAFFLCLELGGETLLRWQPPGGEAADDARAPAAVTSDEAGIEPVAEVVALNAYRRSA